MTLVRKARAIPASKLSLEQDNKEGFHLIGGVCVCVWGGGDLGGGETHHLCVESGGGISRGNMGRLYLRGRRGGVYRQHFVMLMGQTGQPMEVPLLNPRQVGGRGTGREGVYFGGRRWGGGRSAAATGAVSLGARGREGTQRQHVLMLMEQTVQPVEGPLLQLDVGCTTLVCVWGGGGYGQGRGGGHIS